MNINEVELSMFVKVRPERGGPTDIAQVVGFVGRDVHIQFVKSGRTEKYLADHLYKDAECIRAYRDWRVNRSNSIGIKKK